MAYPDGFSYVEGPYNIRWSTASSVATFRIRNPVVMEDVARTLNEADSGSTAIYGIALANAADSIGGPLAGKIPVLVPTEQTVFATKVQTGVAAAVLELGTTFDIEKSGNFFRIDSDNNSTTSSRVVLVERGTSGSALDSADSSVHVQFLKDSIFPFGSNASLRLQD